jgi:hypothetical protein
MSDLLLAVVGLAFAFLFFRLSVSSREFRKEAATLKRYSAMLLRIMEKNGWVKLSTNEAGELVRIIELKATIHAETSTSKANLTITEEKTKDTETQ